MMSDPSPSAQATSAEVREDLIDALRGDIVGPDTRPCAQVDHLDNQEVLPDTARPASFYTLGYLAPAPDVNAARPQDDAEELQTQRDMQEELDAGTASQDRDEPNPDVRQRRRLQPSSMGLSATIDLDADGVLARIRYADYAATPPLDEAVLRGEGQPDSETRIWTRRPRTMEYRITRADLDAARAKPQGHEISLPDTVAAQRSGGCLCLHVMAADVNLPRPASEDAQIGLGVSVFLVNRRPESHRFREASYAFQASLELECETGFIGNPDMSGYDMDDPDLAVHDLHYRDVLTFVGGRNIGCAHDTPDPDVFGGKRVRRIWTDPLPQAYVEALETNPELNAFATFGMRALAQACANGTVVAALERFPRAYSEQFIADQRRRAEAETDAVRRRTAHRLIEAQAAAARRMTQGLDLLAESQAARDAFRVANVAIADYLTKSKDVPDKPEEGVPNWRPFQLAFILMNLRGLSDPTHEDREIVDLLFFPTGGGKTEAYLGLAAYQIAHRRLTRTDWLGSGLSVIMRYTLRLLTLDQLGRASAMICALDRLRVHPEWQDDKGQPRLGPMPIEIGLWVGKTTTPQTVGGPGIEDQDREHAYARVNAYRRDGKVLPAPIRTCPWCGTKLNRDSFKVSGRRMYIHCADSACEYNGLEGGKPLPILVTDQEVYDRLPAFLIATVDKFAALPHRSKVGRLFDHVDRRTAADPPQGTGFSFYGADTPRGTGNPIGGTLPPPDLIIQDELHLISGPLGTIAGLYEAAIDRLSSRVIDGRLCGPKIVASTATVRQAGEQCERLFGRKSTAVFPPPGLSRDTSWFARVSDRAKSRRRYLGISALGVGPRKIFLRTVLPVMAAAQKAYEAADGSGEKNPADPYMTVLGYFSALRELGATRRVVEDEVNRNLRNYAQRRARQGEALEACAFANRLIRPPLELTSRKSTDDVSDAKTRLANAFEKAGKKPTPRKQQDVLDVALATNMISVGLDISRLGLMVVQNQPKTASEYIQATSRVGRDGKRPGLVIVILNMHRPRDRAHYENFGAFHRSFYRAVEATSVTPGSLGAMQRALGAVYAGLVRHLDPAMTPRANAADYDRASAAARAAAEFLSARIGEDSQASAAAIEQIEGAWSAMVDEIAGEGGQFGYGRVSGGGAMLRGPLEAVEGPDDPRALFEAGWSMRDVQPAIALRDAASRRQET